MALRHCRSGDLGTNLTGGRELATILLMNNHFTRINMNLVPLSTPAFDGIPTIAKQDSHKLTVERPEWSADDLHDGNHNIFVATRIDYNDNNAESSDSIW